MCRIETPSIRRKKNCWPISCPTEFQQKDMGRMTWTRILRIWVALYSPADALLNALENVGTALSLLHPVERTGGVGCPRQWRRAPQVQQPTPPWGCLCVHSLLPRRHSRFSYINYCKKAVYPVIYIFLPNQPTHGENLKSTEPCNTFALNSPNSKDFTYYSAVFFLVTINWK